MTAQTAGTGAIELARVGDEPLIAFVARSAADELDKIVNYPSQITEGPPTR